MPTVQASTDACENGQTPTVLSAPQRPRSSTLALRDRDHAARSDVRAFQDESQHLRESRDRPDVRYRIALAGGWNIERSNGHLLEMDGNRHGVAARILGLGKTVAGGMAIALVMTGLHL